MCIRDSVQSSLGSGLSRIADSRKTSVREMDAYRLSPRAARMPRREGRGDFADRGEAQICALVDAAAKLSVPENVALKKPKDFTLIGTPAKRLDTPEKVNGKAKFGIDTMLPGMKFATVAGIVRLT